MNNICIYSSVDNTDVGVINIRASIFCILCSNRVHPQFNCQGAFVPFTVVATNPHYIELNILSNELREVFEVLKKGFKPLVGKLALSPSGTESVHKRGKGYMLNNSHGYSPKNKRKRLIDDILCVYLFTKPWRCSARKTIKRCPLVLWANVFGL